MPQTLTRPSPTPWGPAQHTEFIAPGIARVDTASHGGYWIDPEHLLAMPAELSAWNRYSGHPQWFEEDVEWALVVMAFPQSFPDRSCFYALKTARAWFAKPSQFDPDQSVMDLDAYLATEAGRQCQAKSDAHLAACGHLFTFGCMSGGSGGCAGGIDRVDGQEHYRYTCAEWPRLKEPFTLDAARAAGLTLYPLDA